MSPSAVDTKGAPSATHDKNAAKFRMRKALWGIMQKEARRRTMGKRRRRRKRNVIRAEKENSLANAMQAVTTCICARNHLRKKRKNCIWGRGIYPGENAENKSVNKRT